MSIKLRRKQKGWSQKALAELAGVSTKTIQRVENGETPGLETAAALSVVFGLKIPILFPQLAKQDSQSEGGTLRILNQSVNPVFATLLIVLLGLVFIGILGTTSYLSFQLYRINTDTDQLLSEQLHIQEKLEYLDAQIVDFQLVANEVYQDRNSESTGGEVFPVAEFGDARELLWMVDCDSRLDSPGSQECLQRAMRYSREL